MMVQIISEYGKRTEYKVLEKFATIQEVSIDNISEGILLLPGILLNKLEKAEINILNNWLNTSNNQLILSPAWKEVSLNDYFDISLGLKVLKGEDLEYEGIECQYKVEGKVQEKIFTNEKGDFGVHYRKDTGSGLLTVITLPLLDYKLSHKHDEFRQYFSACMNKTKPKEKEQTVEQEALEIGEDHLQLFILLAAGLKLDDDLREAFRQYFNKNLELKRIEELKGALIQEGFINGREISDKGRTFIKERQLKSFIKVLEGRGRTNEW